jgi:Ser/Thr protein kinase RdoA (MazF antagonist)
MGLNRFGAPPNQTQQRTGLRAAAECLNRSAFRQETMPVEHPVEPPLKERRASLASLAERALSCYGLGDVKPLLLEDTTNLVFRVQLPGLQRKGGFVLRIHAPGQRSTNEIHEELQWLLAIRRDTNLMVPAPVPALDGSLIQEIPASGEATPRQCVLLHWVSGEFRDESLTLQDMQRVGVFMAQLHCHADQFVDSQASPPTRRALFCDANAWTDPPRNATAYFSSDELAMFAAAAQRVQMAVRELGESRDVFGFIHADLHQWNYLFHDQDVRAIDFDDCGWGYLAYDIVVTLSYLETALQDALLAGYQSVRPLPACYAEYRDVFLAARILGMVQWILSWSQPSHRSWGPGYLQEAAGRLRRLVNYFR